MTRDRAGADFSDIKKAILELDITKDFLEQQESVRSKKEWRRRILNLVDLIEFSFLAQPFQGLLDFLCDQSRHRVLASSVKKASADTVMERIIQSVWLADLDSSEGVSRLRLALRDVPNAPFFRIMLATHLVKRVFWNQWRVADRTRLLDAASEVIKIIGMDMNKGEILRGIDEKSSE